MRKIQLTSGILLLAGSIYINGLSWAASPSNTVNDGQIINSGTYLNTPGNMTTFINSGSGGLWLKSGSTLRGVEVNSSGAVTNNGGSFHFNAPNDVVRLDGNINVKAIQNSNGTFLGDGGHVLVDAAYLYQSGNIYANGTNGGLVQFNVGALSLASTAKIEARSPIRQGFTDTSVIGKGGVITIKSTGPIDIGRQVVLDSSGKVAGTVDSTLINIQGSLVKSAGALMANGVQSDGGTIRITSTGQTNLTPVQNAVQSASTAGIFTAIEASLLNHRLLSLKNADGNIDIIPPEVSGKPIIIEAHGAGGSYSGGAIVLTSQKNIHNGGWILANGGNGYPDNSNTSDPGSFTSGGHGGSINLTAGQSINNIGRITADGGGGGLSIDISTGLSGGDAGSVSFSYKDKMVNSNIIRAVGGEGAFSPNNGGNGGNGGRVFFSGPSNLTGAGIVSALGGSPGGNFEGSTPGQFGGLGTIVAPNPVISTNKLYGIWQKTPSP